MSRGVAMFVSTGERLSTLGNSTKNNSTKYEQLRFYIWNTLEQEKPSRLGAIVNIFIVIMIVLNLSIIIIETEPLISQYDTVSVIFLIFETFFSIFFSFEVILRIWSSQSSEKFPQSRFSKRCRYIFSPWNIIDLLSVVPALIYITIIF
jgi:hypothetical protein